MEGIVETVTMFEGSILSATFDTSSRSSADVCVFLRQVFCRVFVGDQERQPTEKAVLRGSEKRFVNLMEDERIELSRRLFLSSMQKNTKAWNLLVFFVYRLLGHGNQKEMSCCCFWVAAEGIGQAAATPATISKKKTFPYWLRFFWWWFLENLLSYVKPRYFSFALNFSCFFICNHATQQSQHPKR